MGNEQSDQHGILKESTIDDDPIIKNAQWSLHHAQMHKLPNPMSVFIGQENGSLENFAKNLRLYRHPDILRFINFTRNSDGLYLFTEKVSPLTVVQNQQLTHQKSLGLQKIAKSLAFLHDVAKVAHNNLSLSSIFVTPEGNWRLAGLDSVVKLTSTSLKKDLNDFVNLIQQELIPTASGGTRTGSAAPLAEDHGGSFVEFIRTQMDESIRDDDAKSPFEELLNHPFLSANDFVSIENFLTNLPVKKYSERVQFFQNLADRLEKLPPTIVASQLGPLLLSRMVLLDHTAVEDFLPRLLSNSGLLFDETLYKEKLIPLLINIFHVRDMQIRLVLLKFFPNYVDMFTENQLEETILPLVLLGIRDVNDKVVAETLKALSILVEKVGSAKVIGGKKRKKIFVDGSPSKSLPNNNKNDTTNAVMMSRKRSQSNERQSPIGAETSDEEQLCAGAPSEPATKLNFDQEDWEPWDDNQDDTIDESVINQTSTTRVEVTSKPTITSLKADFNTNVNQEEQDFFADMEPVIEPTNKLTLEDVQLHDKFAVHHEEGLWNDIDDEAWS